MPQACANCEEVITGTPYEADGEVFCCVGCSGGGPCQCTYTTDGSAALEPAIAIAETAPAYEPASESPVPVATAPIRPAHIEPAPLAWPAPEQTTPEIRRRPQILRVNGLTNQLDLLRLGSELEDQPEVEEMSLVRADLDDVWFAITVADADALATALMRVASFDVDARPHPAGVDASVRAHVDEADLPPAPIVQPEPAPMPAAADTRREQPHARPRFRLFRRSEEPTTAAPEPETAAPVEPVRQSLFAEPTPELTPEPAAAELEAEPEFVIQSDEPARHSLFTTATSAPVYDEPEVTVAEERFAAAIESPASTPEPVIVEAAQAQSPTAMPTFEPAPEVIETSPQPVIEQPAAVLAPPAPAVEEHAAAATAPVREQPSEMLTADSRPGGAVTMREHITLVAYPFRSFVALNEFQDALRALRGVANVKVRRFYRGTLHLGVEYEDMLPLTERLRDLDGFAWRLVSSSEQEIELMLEEQGDLVSSG